MKFFLCILFFLLLGAALHGQGQVVLEKGTVSFLSSRNVYVKFPSTGHINIGDTLFVMQNGELIPALVVQNKSSTSTVCMPLLSETMKVSDEVFAKTASKAKEEKVEKPPAPPPGEREIIADEAKAPVIAPQEDAEPLYKQKVGGQISAASYSNLTDRKSTHRMRYAFVFRGNNVKNSKFSVDSYITFRHTLGEWEEVKENLSQALKVYSLSVNYAIDSTSNLTFGRRINPRMSSVGAIDGFQYEKHLGNFMVGAVAGSRPDFSDYGLNLNLLQAGAYVGYIPANPAKHQQTTFGFIEQRNKAETDRRFVYFQHMGELMENLDLFASLELDLYENIHDEVSNTLHLTNFFASLRYRLSRNLRFSFSYDNRKNIIYYESYKTFIDQLIENESRQGLRFGVSYRPFKFLTAGVNMSSRFQKSDKNASENLNAYLNFSRIPVLNIRASLTANFLQTNFLGSKIFGIRLSREIIRRRLDGDMYFRMVNYHYKTNGNAIRQNIAGASLSLRLMKQLALHLYYEGTFDDQGRAFQRFNTRIIRRF